MNAVIFVLSYICARSLLLVWIVSDVVYSKRPSGLLHNISTNSPAVVVLSNATSGSQHMIHIPIKGESLNTGFNSQYSECRS